LRTTTPLTRFLFCAVLFSIAVAGVAQGPPGQDPYNPPPGHGGVPPGQAKKQGNGGMPPGQAKKYDGNVPPGQAKKWFREEDRPRFYSYYRGDADHWKGNKKKRPVFVVGQPVPQAYVVQPMPQSYWVGAPPPPPGYQYGYYGGYAVVYSPTTRMVADVMDLIGAATGH